MFRTLYNNKWVLFLFLSITISTALVYLYYKPKLYEASATVEVNNNDKISSLNQDIVKEALTGEISSRDIDTEISIIESRFIILDTMKSINMTTHIWGINDFFKRKELYKDSPFEVNITKGNNLKFILTYIDKKFF